MKMGDLIEQLQQANFDHDAECYVEDDMLVVEENEKKMYIRLKGEFEIPKAKNVNSEMPPSKIDVIIDMLISYVAHTSYAAERDKLQWYKFWKEQTGYIGYPLDKVSIDEI